MAKLLTLCFFCCLFFSTFAGCPPPSEIWKQLLAIEKADNPATEKLKQVKALQQQFIACRFAKDSVYARILHRLGVYQYQCKENLNDCIKNTTEAIHINRGRGKTVLPSFLANSYYNLGLYYKYLLFYREALLQFDSAFYFASRFSGQEYFAMQSRLQRSNIYGRMGDYQTSIDEAELGIQLALQAKDSVFLAQLLNEKAQSLIDMQLYNVAEQDLVRGSSILGTQSFVDDIIIDNYRIRARLYKLKGDTKTAYTYYLKAIEKRKKSGTTGELAADFLEIGNFLWQQQKKTSEALLYYQKALAIADKENDIGLKAQVLNNIGALYKEINQFNKALTFYQQALTVFVKGFSDSSIAVNPGQKLLTLTADKQMLFVLLANKAEALMLLQRQTKKPELIVQAKMAFTLTDKVIDEMRYNQLADNTKLYWRNRTREFFTNAITAAYEWGDAEAMFYYMEKSRAVLLNDKLNELGALAQLPVAEAAQEQELRIRIITLQQQFDRLLPGDSEYNKQQASLLAARAALEKFVKEAERKFPAYYQYKYSGVEVDINKLKQFVANQQATYISYYETDSVIYALTVAEKGARVFKLSFADFLPAAGQFLQLCGNRQQLNANYNQYLQTGFTLYQKLFAPLNVSHTKVILSPDRIFLPFDALLKNADGKRFLLYSHAFSYTYSAGFLLKSQNKGSTASQNFMGIAPENFAKSFDLANLQGSAASVEKIKNNFSASSIYTNTSATRRNFLGNKRAYNMLHIYAHAIADSSAKEPRLFLYDSAISLAELQLMKNPPTQLVFLAACQTNVGKQQTGEGVYSLARGFASVGVPSTVATLWQADNEAMYAISELFYQFIKKGIPKDEALRQAKIEFIKSGTKENQLPFFWASPVLVGNTDAVQLSAAFNYWYWLIPLIVIFLIIAFLVKKRRAALRQPL